MFYKPSFLARSTQTSVIPEYEVTPSSIPQMEPVVAAGEIVFAGSDPNIDVVMAPSSFINLTISQVA